jgi:hypothetical protein
MTDSVIKEGIKEIINAKDELIEKIMALCPEAEKIEITFTPAEHYSVCVFTGNMMPEMAIMWTAGQPVEFLEHTTGVKYNTQFVED